MKRQFRPFAAIVLIVAAYYVVITHRQVRPEEASALYVSVWAVTDKPAPPKPAPAPPAPQPRMNPCAIAGCSCGCAEGKPCACYPTMRARAIKEKRPLVVWVGRKKDGRFDDRKDVLHCEVRTFAGFDGVGYVVGQPRDGDLFVYFSHVETASEPPVQRSIVCTPGG